MKNNNAKNNNERLEITYSSNLVEIKRRDDEESIMRELDINDETYSWIEYVLDRDVDHQIDIKIIDAFVTLTEKLNYVAMIIDSGVKIEYKCD